MHPIERLRFVARASGAPAGLLVDETASALRSFAGDPHGLVTACRRIVSRQPNSGVLVWLCAHVLTAADPMKELYEAAGAVASDRTHAELAFALDDEATVVTVGWPEQLCDGLVRRGDVEVLVIDVESGRGGSVALAGSGDVESVAVPVAALGPAVARADVVLLEATAVGPDEFLTGRGGFAAAAVARVSGAPCWLVAGVGRTMPRSMWQEFVERAVDPDDWSGPDERVPLDLVDAVVGPHGITDAAERIARPECPVAPELFRGDVF